MKALVKIQKRNWNQFNGWISSFLMRSFKSETDIFKSGSFAIFRSIIPIVFSPALYPLKTYFG